MGLFSFLFKKKNKTFRTTREAEAVRIQFREDEELFSRIEKSNELKRYKELDEYVNNEQFRQRKKEIENLSFKNSDIHKAEKQHKALSKSKKLKSYILIRNSQELDGYERLKTMSLYQDYISLKKIIESPAFNKKANAAQYAEYKEILKDPKIAALIKLEKMKAFREYNEVKDTKEPEEYDRLSTYLQSDEFRADKEFLLKKNRYQTTDDYKLLCEYEALKKQPEVVKYFALLDDAQFKHQYKWKLSFEDDFDGGKLDAGKWITKYYAGEKFLKDTYGVGNDVQLYLDANISFSNSKISLNFKDETTVGKYWDGKFGFREKRYDYTSAMISSAVSCRQKYGRFEAKLKINHSTVNSYFGVLAENGLPFIEIMKSLPDGVELGSIHLSGNKPEKNLQQVNNVKLANDYYIFTLEWTENKLVWKINDFIVKEESKNIPDMPMYVFFSLGATENPAKKCVPTHFEIDWVRIYTIKE